MADHKHDKANHSTNEIKIGKEWVKYEQRKCSKCGKLMSNRVVNRRPA